MKISWRYCFLILLVYIGIFWSFIQYSLVNAFTYWDELYSLLFGIFIIKAMSEGGCKGRKEDLGIFFSLLLYCMCSLMGNIISNYISFSSVLNDLFLNLKFPMAMYATIFIMRNSEIIDYKDKIIKHLHVITFMFAGLFVFDKVFNVFPVYENRFGINSEQLIFAHPTFCAAALFYLLMLHVLFGDINKKIEKLCLGILLLLICMTLRFKAIAVVLLFVAICIYFLILKAKKLNLGIIGLLGLLVFLVAYKQIYFYFLSPVALNMPRGAILNTSFQIAKDYFPFGTGFGSFGSYVSGSDYSPVYELYGIHQIYGMTKDRVDAISDNYWPMILGQAGIIGFLAMLNMWRLLYIKIDKYRQKNWVLYLAAMGCFLYIVTSSTSESAIVNPACMPLAFVFGMVFSQSEEEYDI